MSSERKLEGDWYPGTIPDNVILDETAYVETSFSFHKFRSSLPVGVEYGRGTATYMGTMFDVGHLGRVRLGAYVLVHGAYIICDAEVVIDDYTLISWNVVLMDTYRLPSDFASRRLELERVPLRNGRTVSAQVSAKPIHIERNVWIGFDSCVLPGVTIGEGAVIGARSVVAESVPPYCIFAGNPARVIRYITPEEMKNTIQGRRPNKKTLPSGMLE